MQQNRTSQRGSREHQSSNDVPFTGWLAEQLARLWILTSRTDFLERTENATTRLVDPGFRSADRR